MAAKKTVKAPKEVHYASLKEILVAKSKGKLPRGSKLEIDVGGDVSLLDSKGARISDTFASEDVAAAILIKLGFKVENKND